MILTIMDRLQLLQLLPEKGDLLTLRIIREAKESLSFSDEDHKEIGFTTKEDGNVVWELEKDPNKDIELSQHAFDMIKDELKRLNDTKELTLSQLEIYEKFF